MSTINGNTNEKRRLMVMFFNEQYSVGVYDLIKNFKNTFDSHAKEFENFDLPIRWDGNDFVQTLKKLFDRYINNIKSLWFGDYDFGSKFVNEVQKVCEQIIQVVKGYLNGKENSAYDKLKEIFSFLIKEPLVAYDGKFANKKDIKLYRASKVEENRNYNRNEIFHTPFTARNKIATTRYSISGYPSLYLSSSVDLCLKELEKDYNPGRYIVSRFEIVEGADIQILDLGLKPSDFINNFNQKKTTQKARSKIRQQIIQDMNFKDTVLLKNYLLWYPLIASCSFMRINKNDPFAVEYIIPQLLMQVIRNYKEVECGKIIGIRYFSCSSNLASNMGFNYVFPTNYTESSEEFCNKLRNAFKLTSPVFFSEYLNINDLTLGINNANTDFIE